MKAFLTPLILLTLNSINLFAQLLPDVRLTNDSALSGTSSNNAWCVAARGDFVHVVWSDYRVGNPDIYYKRSTDAGVTWGADTRLTNNSANSYDPFVAVSGSVVHVVWSDQRDENYEIYYKRNPTGNPIGIININSEIPKQFSLSQNYPNPFNPVTRIRFAVPVETHRNASLRIYDILGSEVVALVNEQLKPGTYEVEWDATNFPSGVYYYSLKAGDFAETKKLVLLK